MNIKKQYKYGDCIPFSRALYKKLKNQGKKVCIVEGYAEVNYNNDILPDEKFLSLFYPEEYKEVEKNECYEDYPKGIPHTWIEVNGKIIDITVNQFDKYSGITQYHILERYVF